MPERCTCGVELPPDARFCHKCGKPQFEMPPPDPEDLVADVVKAELAATAPPPPPPDVGFGNPLAVRIGLLVAVLGFFASVLSGPVVPLPMICLVGAGFLSVYLYRRRTGEPLTARSGARMGWMTGLFAFIILLVLLTTVVLAISDPDMAGKLVQEMRARGADVNAESVVEAFRNPAGIVQIVVMSFVIFTLFPTIGGAIGAKLLGSRPRS